MELFYLIIVGTLLCGVSTNSNNNLLPFTSIKVVDDQIYFTLDNPRKNWHKLLSIESIGSDAIIKTSKDHYGLSKCDYGIECYKYNIIVNFETLFKLIQGQDLPEHISLESEFDNKVQNGVDLTATHEKFIINKEHIEENIKASKTIRIFKDSQVGNIFKGLSKSISQIFKIDDTDGNFVF